MEIASHFRLRHALLAVAFVASASAPVCAHAQHDQSSMPVMAAPAQGSSDSGMAHMHAGTKTPSTTLALSIGGKTLNLAPADLAAFPHETATVINGHTKASETYSGVPISALLGRLGMPFEKANEHALIKTYIVADGTDGYRVVLSTYEALATIRGTSTIVADTLDGKPLTTDGAFKLIIPGDNRPQRWVQNLKSLTFKTID